MVDLKTALFFAKIQNFAIKGLKTGISLVFRIQKEKRLHSSLSPSDFDGLSYLLIRWYPNCSSKYPKRL